MPYTHEQEAEFKHQFAARRKRQIILFVLLVLAVIGVVLVGDSQEHSHRMFRVSPVIIIFPFFLFVAGALIFSFRNWRCPACDGYLGKQMSPRFCAKCGIALQ